jgi:hypothetical protein
MTADTWRQFVPTLLLALTCLVYPVLAAVDAARTIKRVRADRRVDKDLGEHGPWCFGSVAGRELWLSLLAVWPSALARPSDRLRPPAPPPCMQPSGAGARRARA